MGTQPNLNNTQGRLKIYSNCAEFELINEVSEIALIYCIFALPAAAIQIIIHC